MYMYSKGNKVMSNFSAFSVISITLTNIEFRIRRHCHHCNSPVKLVHNNDL